MTKEILLLVDYKKHFGSKFDAIPYRSGMDIEKIIRIFQLFGYSVKLSSFNQVDFSKSYKDVLVLYTSSEDPGLHYKNYIEDVVLALELGGATVVPSYKYLRANNNKVFMEILRSKIGDKQVNSIHSDHFGTLEEFLDQARLVGYNYPIVIKSADGSMSRGVKLAKDIKEGEKVARKISRTRNLLYEIWEIGRGFKHQGYKKDSKHRKKFIVQNFIPNLENDYKVLVFGEKFYVLKRLNRENDFRASGGGRLSYSRELPEGMLDFAKSVFDKFNLPHVSMDIAFDGTSFHLFEFQAIYFGSYTVTYSDFYFKKVGAGWTLIEERSDLEKTYVESIIRFLNQTAE